MTEPDRRSVRIGKCQIRSRLLHMRIRDGQPTCADIPVVFMTARVQLSEVGHYKEIGAVDVIAKPFHPMTISDEVGHIRETWHA